MDLDIPTIIKYYQTGESYWNLDVEVMIITVPAASDFNLSLSLQQENLPEIAGIHSDP